MIRMTPATSAVYSSLLALLAAEVRPGELPDFPPELRRSEPVRDLNEAIVFTVNETTATEDAVRLARTVGSDVLIRGWFKWRQAPPVAEWSAIPAQVHRWGALFGGGITCSALYDGENGISREQLLEMATRDAAGQLVDAWDTPGIRHGSLSSAAYRDYLFRWCREQIDAGVDYLFLDEHTAALSGREGYDDHSLADFRRYLRTACPETKDWPPDDSRWTSRLGIEPSDRAVCPDGTLDSFDYRKYLARGGWTAQPLAAENPLAALWPAFRQWRDDAAWKELTGRIREYAGRHGRRVFLSANGIAPDVDLQVLGVWGQWQAPGGHIALGDNQLPVWRSIVRRGQAVAGRRVPVVLFHDWGFGDPPFPWLAVPPAERELWMRTRGAEIYAAGGFFAFPVLGPFGCNAERDGTLRVIARQTEFYQRHRQLFLRGRYLGAEPLSCTAPDVSLAIWQVDQPPALVLHVINRRTVREQPSGAVRLEPAANLAVHVPGVRRLPVSARVLSPDFAGEPTAACRITADGIEVRVPQIEASALVSLRWNADEVLPLDLQRLRDPLRIVPVALWSRPACSEFPVQADGSLRNEDQLNAFLQGQLHQHLRNPPTFLVDAREPGKLLVKIRAVSTAGAELTYSVDGQLCQTAALPDRDGRNDGAAAEYDRVLELPIPAGRHRLSLDNRGPDWLTVSWYQWAAKLAAWEEETAGSPSRD